MQSERHRRCHPWPPTNSSLAVCRLAFCKCVSNVYEAFTFREHCSSIDGNNTPLIKSKKQTLFRNFDTSNKVSAEMKIAVCLVVKDEARDIPEWIAYHALAGFDAFLVYDNNSSDGTPAVLRAAAAFHDVRVIPWRTPSIFAQMDAYRHALRTNRHEFDWIAMIDSDEFMVIHSPDTLHSLCSSTAAAIGVNWAMFGSNGHDQFPSRLVIESFTRRSEIGFPINRHVKSLVRPSALIECLNPHAFVVDGPTILPDGRLLEWERLSEGGLRPGLTHTEADYTVAQVNHYFTRSRAHWAKKTARGYPNPGSMSKLSHFDVYDRNEVEDTSALWDVAGVRRYRGAILDRGLANPGGPPVAKQDWRKLSQANQAADDQIPARCSVEQVQASPS